MVPGSKEKILAVLNQFGQEEIGNRLSQFAFRYLVECISKELENLGEKEKEVDK